MAAVDPLEDYYKALAKKAKDDAACEKNDDGFDFVINVGDIITVLGFIISAILTFCLLTTFHLT